jgi:hypothetical protein
VLYPTQTRHARVSPNIMGLGATSYAEALKNGYTSKLEKEKISHIN